MITVRWRKSVQFLTGLLVHNVDELLFVYQPGSVCVSQPVHTTHVGKERLVRRLHKRFFWLKNKYLHHIFQSLKTVSPFSIQIQTEQPVDENVSLRGQIKRFTLHIPQYKKISFSASFLQAPCTSESTSNRSQNIIRNLKTGDEQTRKERERTAIIYALHLK